jgi:oligoendopeptidase F
MKDKSLPPRSKVPIEETWHLESIFATSQAWQDAFQKTKNLIPEMQEYQNRLDEGPETLIACLGLMEKLLTLAMKVHVYAGLAMSVGSGSRVTGPGTRRRRLHSA